MNERFVRHKLSSVIFEGVVVKAKARKLKTFLHQVAGLRKLAFTSSYLP